jgi:hypothetical protein
LTIFDESVSVFNKSIQMIDEKISEQILDQYRTEYLANQVGVDIFKGELKISP